MTLQQQKIDITDRVVGRLKDGAIELFLENERIGKITIPSGSEIQLEHHFEGEKDRIYQYISATTGPDARYTDCDEGGWC